MTGYNPVPLKGYRRRSEARMLARAKAFNALLQRRRTVRSFSSDPVPRDIIEACLRAAGSAPSGANQQPWQFVAIADPALKQRIRAGAEAEEREFYRHRAPTAAGDRFVGLTHPDLDCRPRFGEPPKPLPG